MYFSVLLVCALSMGSLVHLFRQILVCGVEKIFHHIANFLFGDKSSDFSAHTCQLLLLRGDSCHCR